MLVQASTYFLTITSSVLVHESTFFLTIRSSVLVQASTITIPFIIQAALFFDDVLLVFILIVVVDHTFALLLKLFMYSSFNFLRSI